MVCSRPGPRASCTILILYSVPRYKLKHSTLPHYLFRAPSTAQPHYFENTPLSIVQLKPQESAIFTGMCTRSLKLVGAFAAATSRCSNEHWGLIVSWQTSKHLPNMDVLQLEQMWLAQACSSIGRLRCCFTIPIERRCRKGLSQI